MSDRVDAIRGKLYRGDDASIWTILDGASVPALRQHLADLEPEHVCLYAGDLQPDMEEVAPYLVKLEREAPFMEWVLDQGWGNHWGIFAETGEDLIALRKHFRKFLTVHDENGKPMIFRYYDPRVLRVYLPTCNDDELKMLFGPVQSYVMEDENPGGMLRFRIKNGALIKQAEPVS
jgi:hypothetical protein